MSLETSRKRAVMGIILILLLIGLCIHYANEYEIHLKHPSYGAILSDYPQGELVNVGGTVTHIYGDSFLVEENYHGQIVAMKIINSSTIIKNHKLSPQDKVSVVGVLGPDNQIVTVQEIDVNDYTGYVLLLFRSFLALAFLVYIFNRYWCFNLESFEFRRR
ncbi:MAG TPA: hypothetical protein PL168_06020 [Methanobacterium sp.]|nr:hypothetical protein [Methanobacterium sp.]